VLPLIREQQLAKSANLVDVSFFDDFPQPSPPQEPAPRRREPWDGPPPGIIGGWVPWRIVLARSENAYAVLHAFEVFPTGLGFDLVMHVRDTGGGRGARHLPHMMTADALRLGVRFADGRKAATDWLGRAERDVGGELERPVLRTYGGGGGGGVFRRHFWLWPVPPAGPLAWVSTWPEMGIGETSVEVDASVLAAAIEETEELWEEGGDAGHPGYAPRA
jgi:hypothetical protein